MLRSDIETISKMFSSSVNELVEEHYAAHTQEHQLTSRIGQRLDDRFSKTVINGRTFSVITQELPDKGKGALEKQTGIDLYIGISVDGPDGFDKGIIVQSKWKDKANWRELDEQCQKMLAISDASYAWLYGPSGVTVVDASEIVNSTSHKISMCPTRHLYTVAKGIFSCEEGDKRQGIPPTAHRREALRAKLQQLEIKSGINLTVSSKHGTIAKTYQ